MVMCMLVALFSFYASQSIRKTWVCRRTGWVLAKRRAKPHPAAKGRALLRISIATGSAGR